MTDSKQISLMNLPDEIIEIIISFLSFDDLRTLRTIDDERLKECTSRTLKNKGFCE